jgi:hypothetical protein
VGAFNLKKTDKAGNKLTGAKFKVSENGKQLYFTQVNAATGAYLLSDTQTADPGVTNELTVGTDTGELLLSGLEGTYEVEESGAPTGFSESFLPKFQVTVTTDLVNLTKNSPLVDNKQYNEKTKSVVKLAAQDTWKLVQGTVGVDVADSPIVVWNVTSVTQLPLTGAAGITLFVALAVLTGGLAIIFVTKAKSSKNTPIAA